MTRFQQKSMSLFKEEILYDETKLTKLKLIYTLRHVQNSFNLFQKNVGILYQS